MSLQGELVGDGADRCAVGDLNGHVVMTFPKPVQWVSWSPETAGQIGEAMARSAYKIKTGIDNVNGGSVINKEIRNRLLTRATHVIRSMQEQGRMPGYIAAEVVDLILSEVA